MASRHPTDDEVGDDALVEATDICIETSGRLAEFWGFTRTMGRVFCVLFLSPRALSQSEIVERLGVSAANVSMSLKGLEQWRAVHKVYERGERRARYSAEPELRTIVRNVFEGRERRELQDAIAKVSEALALARPEPGRPSTGEAGFVIERMAHLEWVGSTSNKLLALLVGEGVVDVAAELAKPDEQD